MFKLVVALALVAACSASYNVGLGVSNNYYVDVGYQYIKIANPQGDVVKFVVDNFYGYNGPQNVWVQFYGQGVAQKAIQYLDQQSIYSQRSQSDILYQIFNNYEGQVDEIEYEKLLNIVNTYVQNGHIHPAIYYALQALNGQYQALNYFDQYQGQYQQGLFQQKPYYKALEFLSGQGYGYGSGAYSPAKYGYGYNQGYYGPYNNVYQYLKGQYGYGANQAYTSGYFGPYNNVFQYLKGQYSYGYPQKFYGGAYSQQYPGYGYGQGAYYGQYPQYGYQYGKGAYYGQYPQYGYQYGKGAYYGQYPQYGYQYGKGAFGSYYPQQYQQYFGGYYPYAARSSQYSSYYPSQSYGSYYGPYANALQYIRQYAY